MPKYNFKVNFDKILKICKLSSNDLVDEFGNVPPPWPIPEFSDLEVISLSMTAEALGVESENLLFRKIFIL